MTDMQKNIFVLEGLYAISLSNVMRQPLANRIISQENRFFSFLCHSSFKIGTQKKYKQSPSWCCDGNVSHISFMLLALVQGTQLSCKPLFDHHLYYFCRSICSIHFIIIWQDISSPTDLYNFMKHYANSYYV